MNIFRIFQRWIHKGGSSANNAPPVFPSTTLIPTGTLEEVDNNGPENDVAARAALPVVDHANSVGSRVARWIEPGGTVTVAGRDIGGMVYLAPEQRQSVRGQMNRPFIDPRLPVLAEGADLAGEGMPYWPSYSGIDPKARATYLDWLASG